MFVNSSFKYQISEMSNYKDFRIPLKNYIENLL